MDPSIITFVDDPNFLAGIFANFTVDDRPETVIVQKESPEFVNSLTLAGRFELLGRCIQKGFIQELCANVKHVKGNHFDVETLSFIDSHVPLHQLRSITISHTLKPETPIKCMCIFGNILDQCPKLRKLKFEQLTLHLWIKSVDPLRLEKRKLKKIVVDKYRFRSLPEGVEYVSAANMDPKVLYSEGHLDSLKVLKLTFKYSVPSSKFSFSSVLPNLQRLKLRGECKDFCINSRLVSNLKSLSIYGGNLSITGKKPLTLNEIFLEDVTMDRSTQKAISNSRSITKAAYEYNRIQKKFSCPIPERVQRLKIELNAEFNPSRVLKIFQEVAKTSHLRKLEVCTGYSEIDMSTYEKELCSYIVEIVKNSPRLRKISIGGSLSAQMILEEVKKLQHGNLVRGFGWMGFKESLSDYRKRRIKNWNLQMRCVQTISDFGIPTDDIPSVICRCLSID